MRDYDRLALPQTEIENGSSWLDEILAFPALDTKSTAPPLSPEALELFIAGSELMLSKRSMCGDRSSFKKVTEKRPSKELKCRHVFIAIKSAFC